MLLKVHFHTPLNRPIQLAMIFPHAQSKNVQKGGLCNIAKVPVTRHLLFSFLSFFSLNGKKRGSLKCLLANNQLQHSLTVRLISSLKSVSVEECLKFRKAGFTPWLSHQLLHSWRREESTQSLSLLCHRLSAGRGGIVKIVKYHSRIYACGVVPPGREPNNSYFLKIAYDSFSVCFRLALSDDLYFHIPLIR